MVGRETGVDLAAFSPVALGKVHSQLQAWGRAGTEIIQEAKKWLYESACHLQHPSTPIAKLYTEKLKITVLKMKMWLTGVESCF